MSSKHPSPSNEQPDPGSAALRTLIRAARGNFGTPLRIERQQGKLNFVLGGEANPAAGKAAVERQIAYGKQLGLPWGMSESGYNTVDAGLNYQYRATSSCSVLLLGSS